MKMELAPHQIDNPVSYDVGDIIDIVEDGELFGVQVSKTEWIAAGLDAEDFMTKKKPLIVNIDGVPRSKVVSFLESDTDVNGDRLKKRLLNIDYVSLWSILPQAKKDIILNDREITVTVLQIKNFLKRKSNGSIVDLGI